MDVDVDVDDGSMWLARWGTKRGGSNDGDGESHVL